MATDLISSGISFSEIRKKPASEAEEEARNWLRLRTDSLLEDLDRLERQERLKLLGHNLEKRGNLPGDHRFPEFKKKCNFLRACLIAVMKHVDQKCFLVDEALNHIHQELNSMSSDLELKTMRLPTSSHMVLYESPYCYPSQRYEWPPDPWSFSVGETSNQSGVSPSSASSSGSGRSYKFALCGGAEDVHLSPRFNPGETSEGASLRNEVLDEVANQRGIPEMRDLCSGATNSTSSISHGRVEFAGDGQARILGRAQDMHPGTYLNRQEISNRGDAVIQIIGDDDRTSPARPDNCSRKIKFLIEFNNIIIGITAQGAVALISSGSSSSPYLRFCAASTGIGFLGSFWANFILKKPKLATILSKVGSVGGASAVIFALGSYLPKDPQWISMVATWAMAVITAMVVAIA